MQLTHLMHTQLHLMMTRHAARYWPITKRTATQVLIEASITGAAGYVDMKFVPPTSNTLTIF